MEYSIRVLVIAMLCLVGVLIILLLIFNFSGETEGLMGGMFDFFRDLLGFSGG